MNLKVMTLVSSPAHQRRLVITMENVDEVSDGQHTCTHTQTHTHVGNIKYNEANNHSNQLYPAQDTIATKTNHRPPHHGVLMKGHTMSLFSFEDLLLHTVAMCLTSRPVCHKELYIYPQSCCI